MLNWDGAGSGPAILSCLIFDISEEMVFKANFEQYRNIFDACIALYWSVPEEPRALDDDYMQAAINRYKALRGTQESKEHSVDEDKKDLPFNFDLLDSLANLCWI